MLFDQVNLKLQAGSLLYVKGPNGAGKTSLLRVLAGLVPPDEGQVLYNEIPLPDENSGYASELIYFGHKLGINNTLSAVENLRFWCQLNKTKCDLEKIYSVLANLNLVGLEDIPAGNLSAGQQRRVALARVWLKPQAKVWILDEPFTALDTQGIAVLSAKLEAFLAQGGTIIMTSHQALQVNCPTEELELEYRF